MGDDETVTNLEAGQAQGTGCRLQRGNLQEDAIEL